MLPGLISRRYSTQQLAEVVKIFLLESQLAGAVVAES